MAKRKGHGGHHGGAWKVAYADFVTAMMALFMVLWICSQSEEIVEATSAYFQNPMGAFSALENSQVIRSGAEEDRNKKKQEEVDADSSIQLQYLKKVADEFYRKLNLDPMDEDNAIDIIVTTDGLRIIVYDRPKQPLFISRTALLTDWGVFVMQNLSWLIDRYPMKVRIDGHMAYNTDWDTLYGPWEMTTERANATRRALVNFALDPSKINSISGHGDTQLLPEVHPDSEKNQRIELSLLINHT